MKPALRLFLLGTALAVNAISPLPADTSVLSAPPGNSTASDGTNTGAPNGQTGSGQRRQHILQLLNLTDAQKQQIKQIRASTTDKKTRRQEIWQILTPAQQQQLKQLRQQRQAAQNGDGSNSQ